MPIRPTSRLTRLTRRLAAGAVLLGCGLAGQALTATAAHAFAVSVSKAQLKNGQLLVEGSGATGRLRIASTTSLTTTRPLDTNGRFKAQADGFTSPDCTIVIEDQLAPTIVVSLSGCVNSVKPVPARPGLPSGSCVIDPIPATSTTVGTFTTVWFSTTGCSATTRPVTFTIVAGALPDGMSDGGFQSNTTGNVTGRVAVRGTFRFTVQVTDERGQTDQENATVTVN